MARQLDMNHTNSPLEAGGRAKVAQPIAERRLKDRPRLHCCLAIAGTMEPGIAGAVAAMTEGDPGVASERASYNTPG